ncbi:MAG: endonuclease domain-containing protein [Candidatus Sericytochromatia bacterium]|nr:endonuclease domain-containing protein [Candidatus Sericytochromatia bacterium]
MFDPSSVKKFRFVSYEFDEISCTAKLNYAFDDNYYFTEEIIFNNLNLKLDDEQRKALDNCLKYLHLVAGSSYYKAAIPPEIVIENQEIDQETALFMEKLYLNGLGEFAYRNGFDLREKIKFPFSKDIKVKPSNITLIRRSSVPVGGGKDSVVTIEAMIESSEPIVLFSVGNPRAIKEVCQVAEIQHIVVTRKLSPLLFELNSQGALNGHVPISAIIAFILVSSSVLYGFDKVAMSNERSASVGNFIKDGFEVNHQYSKGLEFEKDVSDFFQSHVLANFNYLSFLRPLSELSIAKLFSKAKKYHSVFTSCNAAFKINEAQRTERWCLHCDKCRFVFLSLAPFLTKDEMMKIFTKNLLNEERQIKGYEELIGISGHKPFECVGEVEESVAAFVMLSNKPEWKDDLMVKMFIEIALPKIDNVEQIIKNTFTYSSDHRLDKNYEEILHAYSGT